MSFYCIYNYKDTKFLLKHSNFTIFILFINYFCLLCLNLCLQAYSLPLPVSRFKRQDNAVDMPFAHI